MVPILQVLDLERRGAVAHVWLNRPEARNAMNDAMARELPRLFQSLQKDPSVRVVVLSGRGSAFCSGADLGKMEKAGRATGVKNRADALKSAKFFNALYLIPKPTIARVHGPAFAGGMGLVCACDVVVGSEDAMFCLPETRIGLVPAMISPYVVRAMGANVARRYVLSGERFSAQEAKAMGLVHELVPAAELDATVERIAQAFVACAPNALAEAKKLLRNVVGAPITPQLISYTAGVIARCRSSAEAREGIAAFREKRKPRWAA
ncbi:MAG: enoyl-CoA hydratase/isomerase family protein [Betaproteobacteria bacterium]|nr:enoyl-CoA hydratase/isomerase family protein [Betaproteobacteria bacterium]